MSDSQVKFKVGDKVKHITSDEYYIIEAIDGRQVRLKNFIGLYNASAFELMEENMNKQFTKDQLVAGKHVVRYTEDDTLALVLESREGKFLMFYEDTSYAFELETGDYHEVYEIEHPCQRLSLGGKNLKLIWQREEKSQSQIELEKLQQQICELQAQAEKIKLLNTL